MRELSNFLFINIKINLNTLNYSIAEQLTSISMTCKQTPDLKMPLICEHKKNEFQILTGRKLLSIRDFFVKF
jgi:hypothetical protein